MSRSKKTAKKPEFDLHFVIDEDSGRWFLDYENLLDLLQYTADELGGKDSQQSIGTAISLLEGMKAAVEQAEPAPPGETQH